MKKLLCIILLILLLTANVGRSEFVSVKMFGQMLNLGHWSTDGLVFYWRGIEAGNAVDESLYRNDGTITGATWVGDGLSFNGSGDYVSTTDAIPIGQTYTFVWRQRIDSTSGQRQPFGLNFSAQFFVDDGITLMKVYDGNFLTCTISDIVGEWTTYAFVGTPTSRALFRNGVANISDNNATFDYTSSNTLHIGRRKASVSWWNGGISDFKIYNRTLSASEIQQLYINPDLPMQQEPMWWFKAPAPSGIVPIIQAHTRRRRAR